jgi:hypothetical protein
MFELHCKGKMIRVVVLQEGIEYERQRYRSLSVIAKAVMHASGTLE